MLQPGSVVGSYEVGESIGHGGMGVVYRAVHRDLDREVALKVLAPQFSGDEDYRRRFLSEARTLARLESNHIVAIYDAGEHQGSLYLAMQLVTDGDLSSWSRRFGPMPPVMALDLLRQVTTGLATAHDAGVLHRDIKASNVLLRRLPGGATRAYLCDFGIAQTADESHTRTGAVVGTWAYLAPERHRGVPASVSSDLYALGCLLWAMLTGHTPYQGSTEMEVALAHMNAPVPQLPGGSGDVRALNHLLARLLDKDPARRISSAGEVLAEIDRVAAAVRPGGPPLAAGAERTRTASYGGPTGARSDLPAGGPRGPGGPGRPGAPGAPGRAGGAPVRRRRGLVAGALALVLVAGLGVGVWALTSRDDDGDGGGTGDVPFADDTVPGIVEGATLTTTPCDGSTEGLRVTGVLPETGVLAQQAPPVLGGLGLAVSDINDAGGVLGQDVCQDVVDSGDDDTVASLLADGVDTDVVVGPIQSELSDTLPPVLDDEEVVNITPSSWVNDRSGVSRYAFRTIGDMDTMANALVRTMLDRVSSGDDVAFVTADEPFSLRSSAAIESALEEVSMECLLACPGAGQDVPESTTDFTAIAQQVATSGATAVVVNGYLDSSALLVALAATDFDGPVYLSAVSDTDFVDVPADILARTFSVFPAVQSSEDFQARVADWYALDSGGTVPTPFLSAESYDAVVLAALAAVRGGATDGDTIAENMGPVSGSGGGTQCASFRRCAALLEAGEEIVYRGVAVRGPFNEDNDLTEALFSTITFDEAGNAVRGDNQVLGRQR
ncbi:MAG: bifunctional serine/threonine-protein kinase/ABC transporter substrate-binding protein [Nocardioides alkalitolerans]